MSRHRAVRFAAALAMAATTLLGCHNAAPNADDRPASNRDASTSSPYARASGYDPQWNRRPVANSASPSRSATPRALGSTRSEAAPIAPGDPQRGRFGLAAATATLPPGDGLVAHIDTVEGRIDCRLWPQRAPVTVAHFMGLANGTRAWRGARGWHAKPAYDGSLFHRVSRQNGIRGGLEGLVPKGAPGFWINDERWSGMKHDEPGLLCAVGAGADRVGMEFLITSEPLPQLDRPSATRAAFTVFGRCTPLSRIRTIATRPSVNGRPHAPVVIEQLRVTR